MNWSLSLRPCWRGKGEVWKDSYDRAFARSMFSWSIDAVSQFSEAFCDIELTRKGLNDFAVSLILCCTFMVLYLLQIWRLPPFHNEAPHSRYGGPLSQICPSPPLPNYGTSLQIWLLALTLKPSTSWLDICSSRILSAISVSAVTKLITRHSQISVDLRASKGLFCNICALPAFVSEKEKKRINPPYRTWCDWRCSTFSRTYSRKSEP